MNGMQIMDIMESYDVYSPSTFTIRRELPAILEAAMEAEDDLDLDEEIEDGKKDFAKNKHISDDDDDESEGTPLKNIKAEAINKNKYTIQILIKLYDRLLNRVNVNSIPTEAITQSGGDIKKLGKLYKDKTYYEVFKAMNDTHRPVAESFGGGDSKYFEIFEKFLNNVEKYTPKFKKAHTKKKENLVKIVYMTSVMYLMEMSTVLSATTVHIFNKGSKSFDRLLEETKEYKALFEKADKFFNDNESDIPKFMTQDISISESAIREWYNNVDNLEEIDGALMDITESVMNIGGTSSRQIGLAHVAKLLKYGLSVTLYKLFGLARYIMYVTYYQKFTIARKIQLISSSLELVESDGDANVRNEKRSTSTQSSIEYKADIVQSTNKALVDSNTNDGKDAIEF